MKKVEFTCDKCGKIIDGESPFPIKIFGGGSIEMAGGGQLCTLSYEGTMGHNEVPSLGWHFHYQCFSEIVAAINNLLPKHSL